MMRCSAVVGSRGISNSASIASSSAMAASFRFGFFSLMSLTKFLTLNRWSAGSPFSPLDFLIQFLVENSHQMESLRNEEIEVFGQSDSCIIKRG